MFRDQVFNGGQMRLVAPVETPYGRTFVRTITAGEKDDLDMNWSKDGKFRCRLVMLSCCDADGKPEFSNADLPAIDELPTYVIEPIVDAALKINKTSKEDMEEIRKNLLGRDPDSSSG